MYNRIGFEWLSIDLEIAMEFLNRLVAAAVFLLLLIFAIIFSVAPFAAIDTLQEYLAYCRSSLEQWQSASPTNFIIGQATLGIAALLIFGLLSWLTVLGRQNRGVIIHTTDGSLAELDTNSITRRLEWHLEQVAEVNNVLPAVKARGGAVDIRLEIEVDPDVDIPMKTDEIVLLTRSVIEETIGLRLGKLDVHLRCAPMEQVYS